MGVGRFDATESVPPPIKTLWRRPWSTRSARGIKRGFGRCSTFGIEVNNEKEPKLNDHTQITISYIGLLSCSRRLMSYWRRNKASISHLLNQTTSLWRGPPGSRWKCFAASGETPYAWTAHTTQQVWHFDDTCPHNVSNRV